jgi:hypothetical protein
VKVLLFCLFLFAPFSAGAARVISLGFEPGKQVVEFDVFHLHFYTDTASLFSIHEKYGEKEFRENEPDVYYSEIRKMIRCRFAASDTVRFNGSFIGFNYPFGDGCSWNRDMPWHTEREIILLVLEKKVKITDEKGRQIRQLVVKRAGSKKAGAVKRQYIDKETNEVLFDEILRFYGEL